MTDGFDVFVQLVIAAITTEPSRSSPRSPPISTGTLRPSAGASLTNSLSASRHAALAPRSGTRSCGRLGPARLGSTEPRSSSRWSLNSGSGMSAALKSPCARVYAATRATRAGSRAVSLRYASVSSSTGKNPIVAPYSGAMLAMVVRSAAARLASPGP